MNNMGGYCKNCRVGEGEVIVGVHRALESSSGGIVRVDG